MRKSRPSLIVDPKIRFLQKVQKTETCWEWKSGTAFYIGGGKRTPIILAAPRAAYTLFIGPAPLGSTVSRNCGNSNCVNPKHLFLKGIFISETNRREK